LNHLLPMFGVPQRIAQLQILIANAGQFIGDNIVGPLRLALNPITNSLDQLKEIAEGFIKDFIKDRWGIDIDQFELLTKLSNKMDLASVTIGGVTVPMFKPGDHAKLDGYMGIIGVEHSQELQGPLQEIPGITFYPNATFGLDQDVEFDQSRFAAYADAVTMSKLLLLQENAVPGETIELNQLSALVNNTRADLGIPLATPYDWSKLNVNGDHGGNIFTTTLQRPGGLIPVFTDKGPTGMFSRDDRPWLRLIDGLSWREET